jgi:hypothetical protein
VMPWYSNLRGGYVDLISRQPLNASLPSLAPAFPAALSSAPTVSAAAAPAPKPLPSMFPMNLPSLPSMPSMPSMDFMDRCARESDALG